MLAALLGLILWILPLPPKAQEAGRLLFFVGIFWIVSGEHGPVFQIR